MKAMKEFVQTKKDLFYSLLITIIAGILRFFHLGRKSLWNDELSQLYVSSSSISDFLANISYHPSPPLDYLLLKIPLLFGSSEFLVRLNAAIFGTLTIFVFYHLSRIQFNREIAIISSILLAFSRFHIRFSQEARMYSLFCLLTTLSFYLLWLYIIHKKTKYFYILLAVDLAILYTHYYGIFVIITHGILLVLHLIIENEKEITKTLKQLIHVILGFLAVGILFLPWINIMLTQINRDYIQNILATGSSRDHQVRDAQYIFIRSSWSNWPFFNLEPTDLSQFIVEKFELIFNSPWPIYFYTPFEIIFPILGILGFAWVLIHKRDGKPFCFHVLWLFLPIFLVGATTGKLTTRYFIFVLPPYLVLISLGIVGVKEWITKKGNQRIGYLWADVTLTLMALVIISSLISYYYHTPKDSWNKVGKYLNKHANPADTILILGGDSDYLGYYYNGPSEILDAGFIFKEKSDIDDMIDFINYVENSDCKWIFISQHSNKLFGNVFGSYKIENLESIRTILQEQFDKIEKVYTLEAHDLKEIDLPGLYRSKDCNPQ